MTDATDDFEYKLDSAVWEITLACCFSCKYCGSKAGKPRRNELSTEECLRVADELAELKCRRVSLIGGEVFMRKDYPDIIRRLTENGIITNIITNGFVFTDQIISFLKTTGIESVSVSIDGTREIHDEYRCQGSFEKATAAIRLLSENNIPVSVISTLHGKNVKCLRELYDYLLDFPIFAWQLQACSPMGNANENMNNPLTMDYAIDPSEVISFVEEKAFDSPFSIGIADNIGYFTPSEGYLRGNTSGKAYFKGCSAGISSIGIDSIGNVRGCESMYDDFFIEGNLREKTLREIWENPDGFAYNRKFSTEMLTGKCSDCKMGPYCAGGCRSFNFFTHGKLYEAPRCARIKYQSADK